jgi:hypothetical protein
VNVTGADTGCASGNNPYTDGTAGSPLAGRGAAEYERQDAIALAERATGRTQSP